MSVIKLFMLGNIKRYGKDRIMARLMELNEKACILFGVTDLQNGFFMFCSMCFDSCTCTGLTASISITNALTPPGMLFMC